MRYVATIILLLLTVATTAQTTTLRTAPGDTLDLYGGPGTLEGKFQTATGDPDPQGWVGVDDSAPPPAAEFWRISTNGAANLDPGVPGNHAWWCGQDLPACSPSDSAWGYGNNWNVALGTSRTVDPDRQTDITLTGMLNVDLEPGYDMCLVEAMTAAGAVTLLTLDGIQTAHSLNETFTWQPGDYPGDAADEIQVRLRVTSDGGWSDEDCSHPTAGALQADNLQLALSQPGLPPDPGPVETCEPGDPVTWTPVTVATGVGNFAQLWTDLDDMDPDQDNHSPQWAFINDGLIVPGLDPSRCWTKCYGPDSLSVYFGDGSLRSAILSPAIALPENWSGSLRLAFDAYQDPAECYPVYLTWAMLTTTDPAGEVGWVENRYDFMLGGAGPEYRRWELVADQQMVPPDSRHVRIKLQAHHIGIWCWGPQDSPAPYLDNVHLQLGPLAVSDVPDLAEFTVSAAPNPFNPTVVIRWNLPRDDEVAIKIHDARGRLVRQLRSGPASAGPGQVTWRGRDDAGQGVATGVYFCRVESAVGVRMIKVTLLK